MASNEISLLGVTNFRRQATPFGIKQIDRLSHVYLIGKTGVGKSTLIETLARQDIIAGRGCAIIDPHGDLVERLVSQVPAHVRSRVRYLNAPDRLQPFGYNPLRRVSEEKIPLAASGLLETLRKLWPEAWGVRMEHVLRNSLFALLEREGSTLPDILRLYRDKAFRFQVARGLRNETVRTFWLSEFAAYQPRQQAEAVAPIQNKVGALLADPLLYRVLVHPKQDLHFRQLMDEGQVLLVNLAKGEVGEDSATTLGSLLVSTLGLAAFSRSETRQRRPFFLYVDEFQTFTTLAFADLMSELRKYGVGLTLAHQHLAQLDQEIRQAVLGNAGTIIAFRVGAEDATHFAREFQPAFDVQDLMNLANRNFYLKLMIDGSPSQSFSARLVGL